ncbi:MAG: mobile mystery protein B [Chitinophagales bacterium]
MGLNLEYTEGQTPIDANEQEGLRITHITLRRELDEFEQQNVEQAFQWVMGRSFSAETVLTEEFICRVHQRMFGDVWSWAGSFRHTEKNIGIAPWLIPTELRKLLDDTKYWLAHGTYTPDEIAVRFKHRLVSIHCFPNGNGRHSRLMADILAEKLLQQQPFTWGASGLSAPGQARTAYLHALRAADKHDHALLLAFARS